MQSPSPRPPTHVVHNIVYDCTYVCMCVCVYLLVAIILHRCAVGGYAS